MSPIKESPVDSGKNRRRSERRPYIIEAWISSPTAKTEDDRCVATALNISRHGVAFQTEKELPIHAYHVIEIGYGEQQMVSEIRTVSCRKVGKNLFEIGAEFC
jgi:hypothetical protein